MTDSKERKISKFHLFRIGHPNGKEKWIAYETKDDSNSVISGIKEKIAKAEKKASPEKSVIIWYVGNLKLWKN